MELARLTLGQLGLLLAGAWAVTLALHLLRVRRKRAVVASLQLWEQALAPRPTAQLLSRLRQLLSLLLSLCIVTLLALAFADPTRSTADGGTSVLLIDAGLSMQATDVAPSRLGLALRRAHQLVDSRNPADAMIVVQMDDAPRALCPMTRDAAELHAALGAVHPSRARTRFAPAAQLALQMLRGTLHPKLLLLSDGAFSVDAQLLQRLRASGVVLEHVRFGKRSHNLRVSALAARRYPLRPDQTEVLVEAENGGDALEHPTLQLFGDGQLLQHDTLEVPGHARVRRFYENLGGVGATLRAQLTLDGGTHDDLAADDEARAELTPVAHKHVLLVGPGNRYLEAALLLEEYLDVDQLAPAQYRSTRGYDLVIFDGVAPRELPAAPALYLAPPAGTTQPISVGAEVSRPYFDQQLRAHPLLRFVALGDVNVAHARRLRPARDDVVVASSADTPLLVTGVREGRRFVVLGFDVRDSDLPLRVAWPLLLLNVIEALSPSPTQLPSSTQQDLDARADIAPHSLPWTPPRVAHTHGSAWWTSVHESPWWLLTGAALLLLLVEWVSYQRRWIT